MKIDINYRPTKPQRIFHESESEEILYGGAAGGGKSVAMVIDALIKACTYPNCIVYLVRRTYKMLEDALITEAKRWYPAGVGAYNEADHTFYLVNGSEIRFRHFQHFADKDNFQGAQISFLYVDELTQFQFEFYDYLLTRMRAPKGLGYIPQVKNGSNPTGVGHSWVKKMFVDGMTPNEIKYKDVYSDYLKEWVTVSVQFIPAFLKDNPHLGRDYVLKLERRGEKTKRALLYGDWNIFEGMAFEEWRNDPEHYDDHKLTHVINPFQIPAHWKIFKSYDYGYAKPYSVLWFAIGEGRQEGHIYLVKELYGAKANEYNEGIRETAVEQAKRIYAIEHTAYEDVFMDTKLNKQRIWQTLEGRGLIDGVADPSIWDNSAGMNESIGDMITREKVYFRDARFDPEAKRNVVNNRLQGKQIFHECLKFQEDERPLFQVFNTCKNFIEHIPELTIDEKNPEDVATERVEDHDYDALRYMLTIKKPKPKVKPEKVFVRDTFDPIGIKPQEIRFKNVAQK